MPDADKYVAWHFNPSKRTAAHERELKAWGEAQVRAAGGWVASNTVRERGVKPGDQTISMVAYVSAKKLERILTQLIRNPNTTAIELVPWGANAAPVDKKKYFDFSTS